MMNKLSFKRGSRVKILILLLLSLILICGSWAVPLAHAQEEKEVVNLAIFEPLQENIYNYSQKNSLDIFKLAYKSIFIIDEQERLQTDLLEGAVWSPDHLSLELTLRQGLEFSSGESVKSEDLAFSILYYRYYLNARKLRDNFNDEEFAKLDWQGYLTQNLADPESFLEYTSGEEPPEENTDEIDSVSEQGGIPENPQVEEQGEDAEDLPKNRAEAGNIYRAEITGEEDVLEALELIEKIELKGRDKLVLKLSEQAIRLPWYLTFPILPKDYAAGIAEGLAPSSGEYKISLKGEDILLTKHADNKASEIRVRSFKDFSAALRAFNNGDIDLLFCPPEEFSNLSLRKDLRSVAWDGAKFNILLCNKAYSPFADPEYGKLLREAIKLSAESNLLPAEPFLPYRSNDWRAEYKDEKIDLNPAAKADLAKLFEEDSVRLAAQSTSRTRACLSELKTFFSNLDLDVSVDLLSQSIQDSMNVGETESLGPNAEVMSFNIDEVDFLLLSIELSLPTDFTMLIDEINKQLGGYYALPKLGTQEHILDPLYLYSWNHSPQDAEVLSMRSLNTVLQEYILAQGIYPLGFEQEGFILGPRVENSFRAYQGHPYKNVEVIELCP